MVKSIAMVLSQGLLCPWPQGMIWQGLQIFFVVGWVEGLQWAPRVQRPGMPLNILRCT